MDASWAGEPIVETMTWPLEPWMIKLISDPGDAGYVPLCAALLWIMSDAGARSVMSDEEAWEGAVNKLWPLICSGEIELNGLPRGGGLTVQVQQHWSHHFNDRLYITGQRTPAWTHLQLLKAELLRRWPRPAPTTKAQKDCYGWLLQQMKASPRSKPKSKGALWSEARARFKRISRRQFDRTWDKAITDSGAHVWSRAGRLARKSNRRTK